MRHAHLGRRERLAFHNLILEYGEIGLGCIGSFRCARGNPRAQRGERGPKVQYRKRNGTGFGGRSESLALRAPEEGCVYDHRETAFHDEAAERAEASVRRRGRRAAIDPAARCRAGFRQRPESMQPFALDVRAYADRARPFQERLRQGGLAAAREAVSDDQRSPRGRGVASCKAEVGAKLADEPDFFGPRDAVLHGTHQMDLRPNQGPVHQVEAQDLDATMVAGDLQVAVEEAPTEPGMAAVVEVHYQKSDLAHHIDPAEFLVELDAIERHGLAVDHRDIAEMEIAVAFADG